VNACYAVSPCRRTTTLTESLPVKLSATISAFCSAHRREVAGRADSGGVEHGTHGGLVLRLGLGCEATDLQGEVDVVGVVAQARLQEGIGIANRGERAGQAAGSVEDGVCAAGGDDGIGQMPTPSTCTSLKSAKPWPKALTPSSSLMGLATTARHTSTFPRT
jgi:hypothetical protein